LPTSNDAAPADDAAGGSTGSKDVAHAARSGAMQTLTIAVQGVLTVTHVLLARLFGPAVFGSYQACLAIVEMLTRAGTGGADKGMLRYVAAYRARGEADLVRSALGTGLRLAIGVGGVLAALLIAGASVVAVLMHETSLEPALRVMAPAAVFTGLVYVLVNASLAAKVTRANFIVRGLGEPLFLMAAGLLAAVIGRSLVHLAVAHVCAAAATFALATFVVGRVFGRGELARAVRSPWLPGFAHYSTPLGAAELMNTVQQRADIVLLTTFVSPSAAAVYAAAEFISRVIGNARYVFDAVAAPVFSEAIHLGQRDRLLYNLRLMCRWVATAAVPIAVTVMVLRHELLSLYGPAFTAGATAMVLLATSHLVNATVGLAGYILVVGGRSRLVFANNVAVTIVNVGLALLLIPRFGLVGAAVAALTGVALWGLLVLVQVRLIQGIYPFGWATLKPFLAGAAALGVEMLIRRQVDLLAVRIPLVIIAGLAAYLIALLSLGLAPEERRLAASIWTRIRGR
jgi:O-antigen/teichoic acid export membrane protein